MSPGGRADPSAQTHASTVIHLRFPSWIDAFTSFFIHIRLLNTLFVLPSTPIMKPFSSILYIWRCSILYSFILSCNSRKYCVYLSPESAWWRTRSIPELHLEMRWMLFLEMKRV